MRNLQKIFLVGAIFLLTAGIAVATTVPIEKTEKLGPYNQGHKYYIRIYNVDDIAKAYVNGELVRQETFLQDSGWVEITDNMSTGSNTIEFDTENVVVGWTYGYEIRQDDSNIIFRDECGIVDSYGCFNNDPTRGTVYHNVITITGSGVHTPKH